VNALCLWPSRQSGNGFRRVDIRQIHSRETKKVCEAIRETRQFIPPQLLPISSSLYRPINIRRYSSTPQKRQSRYPAP